MNKNTSKKYNFVNISQIIYEKFHNNLLEIAYSLLFKATYYTFLEV